LAGNVPPWLCFDGSNYVSFSYSENTADGSNADLTIQRVNPAGTLLDPSPGLFISQFADIQVLATVGIGCGQNQSLVLFTKAEPQVFNAQEHLFGMLVDGNGVPTGTQGFPIQATSNPVSAAVAFDGTNYLVVWQADGVTPGNATGIYSTRVSSSGAVLDAAPVLLASGTTFTTAPAVGFDGTNYLVAWGDTTGSTNGIFSIYGRRVSPSGALLDGPPGAGALQISSGVQTNRLGPAIAFNGTEYLVAWIGANGVVGARVTPAGTLSSGVGYEIQISDGGVSSVAGPLTATSGPAPQFTWLNQGSSGFSLVDLIAYPF
jgi:hypothetical protein